MLDLNFFRLFLNLSETQRQVAGSIVGRSSSFSMIAHSNLSHVPLLLMHVGKLPAAMLPVKRSAGVAPEIYLRECKLYSPSQQGQIRENPELRGDITRNPKQGYQWPQNRTCECVRHNIKKKPCLSINAQPNQRMLQWLTV